MNNVFSSLMCVAILGLCVLIGFDIYGRIYGEDGFYVFTDEDTGMRCAIAEIKGDRMLHCIQVDKE